MTILTNMAIVAADTWTPVFIGASLVAWFEDDSMTVATGHVPSWTDKTGNGHTLAEATHPPTYSVAAINGHAAASFDGTQQLGVAAQLFTTAYTIATVLRPRAAGGSPMLADGNGTTGVELLEAASRIVQYNNVFDLTGSTLAQSWELWLARCTAAPVTTLQVNGTNDPLTGSSSSFIAPAAGSRLTIGARWNGVAYVANSVCDVAALLICNTALDNPTTALLTSYLRGKYGL